MSLASSVFGRCAHYFVSNDRDVLANLKDRPFSSVRLQAAKRVVAHGWHMGGESGGVSFAT